jgi:hypothetical protein
MATDIRQLLPTNVRAALLAGSAPSSINPYVTASALSSFGFVPYTGATADVDLGAFSLTSPTIYGSGLASGTLTLQSTSNATKGKILFGTSAYDEVNNRLGLGTTSPAFDFDLIKSVPASYVGANVQNTNATGYSFIEVLGDNNTTYASLNVFNTAGGVGTFYDNNTAGVATNSPTLSFLTNESATGGWVLTAGGYGTGSEKARFTINATSFRQAAATSGAITQFTFTNAVNTNQTASTNIPNFRVNGSSKQWLTGTVANQYWNYLTANTAAFVGASTLSESVALQIEAATAGTNATITNNFALGLLAGTATVKIGNLNGSTTNAAVYMNQAIPSGTNYTLRSDTAGNTFFNGGQIFLCVGGTSQLVMNNNSFSFQSLVAATTGAVTTYTFNSPNHSGQTASTEIVGQSFNTYTRTWLQGNITNQREMYLRSVNYAFSNPSTITNAYRLYIESATNGGNATITNNYALGLAGSLKINDTFNIVFDTTTGSKIMTSNLQKGAFWGATPIVQPTTAVASATVVSGAGGNVKHDDTFDGYTVEQVVRAIRNTGLLA